MKLSELSDSLNTASDTLDLILTRLLFPEAFGLMALVQVFMGGLQMFSDLGVNMSIIQSKRGEDPDFLNTAWTFQILRGLIPVPQSVKRCGNWRSTVNHGKIMFLIRHEVGGLLQGQLGIDCGESYCR
jgi:hypothetical protein